MGARIAYLSGPIDAKHVYEQYRRSEQSDYFGTIYLIDVLRLIEESDADGLVITTLSQPKSRHRIDSVTFVNLPLPIGKTGVLYHFAMLGWALRCMLEIVRYRTDIALLTAGQDYFWVMTPLRIFGIRLIASLHCTLWPKYASISLHQRLFSWLNGRLFFPTCDHIQAVSQEAVHQISLVSPTLRAQPKRFIATYDPARFETIELPSWPTQNEQFRLLYVGRIEENKGVLDLVEVMHRLELREPGRFHLDICGEGSAAEQLQQAIGNAQLLNSVQVHGQCVTSALARLYGNCHAVVVPTRSDFEEGTPKIAFEAVLNFRPVVMSAACPALADVAPATVEPKVDDVEDYVRAIRELSEDPVLYSNKARATCECRQKHFDLRNGYGAVLKAGLDPLLKPA